MSLQNNYTRSPYGMNSNMGGPSMKNGLGNIPGPAGGPTGFPNNIEMEPATLGPGPTNAAAATKATATATVRSSC